MKNLLILLLLSNTLIAQEVYWQTYVSVQHPITGATDTAWFGLGNVEEGYNPYLDSLFYGNHDSLQDIRILGFDKPAYDFPVQTPYLYLTSPICADLHRNIRPLIILNSYSHHTLFHFMVWVDESNFEDEQYAQLELDGTALINLFSQNVAHWGFFETDSAYLSYFEYGINLYTEDYYNAEIYFLIGDESFWSSGDTICDLMYELNDPLCPIGSGIKVYHIKFYIGFHTYSRVGIAPHSKQIVEPYPNPTSGMLYGLGKHEKQLYNAQGQCLATFRQKQWDLSPYPPGIYFLYQQNRMQSILKY